jgi:hypothetical protein
MVIVDTYTMVVSFLNQCMGDSLVQSLLDNDFLGKGSFDNYAITRNDGCAQAQEMVSWQNIFVPATGRHDNLATMRLQGLHGLSVLAAHCFVGTK